MAELFKQLEVAVEERWDANALTLDEALELSNLIEKGRECQFAGDNKYANRYITRVQQKLKAAA